jgi:hypothetical protein
VQEDKFQKLFAGICIMRLVGGTGREIKVALKRCYTLCEGCRILAALLSGFFFHFHEALDRIEVLLSDRLRVKEPTTLEAKKGQYKKEYAEEHSHPWRFFHMRFFVLYED